MLCDDPGLRTAILATLPTLDDSGVARQKTGSTDFGNVMRHVPGTCIRVAFVPEGAAAHSQEYHISICLSCRG